MFPSASHVAARDVCIRADQSPTADVTRSISASVMPGNRGIDSSRAAQSRATGVGEPDAWPTSAG
jgi:hypothetical protein